MRNSIRIFLGAALFSLVAVAQQAAACYENNGVKICKGDTVYFVNDGKRSIGKAEEVFANGSVTVAYDNTFIIRDYYGRYLDRPYTRSVTTLRDASEISPAVSYNRGIFPNDCVSFYFNNKLFKGRATHVFADGRVRVETDSSGVMYPLIVEHRVGARTQCTR
jgi:hypothetical protein